VKLRKVLLIMDQSFSAKKSSRFNFQARSLGHFIGRNVSKLRLDTPYVQLVVAAQSGDLPTVENYFPQSLLIRVKFDIANYKELDQLDDCEKLNAYFTKILFEGLETVQSIDKEVASACENQLKAFSEGGYVNTWTHASLKISKTTSVSLMCCMTCKEFVATLCIYNAKTETIESECIAFRSKPDELMFDAKLGKLQLVGESVFLMDKFGKSVGSINVSTQLKS
jgi:hypothetical protein